MLAKRFTFLMLFFLSVSAYCQKIVFVTEDLPPLQIDNPSGKATGALIEVVELIIKEANIDAEIKVYPWARSYEQTLNTPNTFIFSMLRSKVREDKFHWVGKFFTIRSYLAKLKSREDILVNDIEDAKQYSVGSIRHDLAESYLLNKGFQPEKNLYVSSKYSVLWSMLYSGRTDIAFTNSDVWNHEILASGLDPNKITFVYEIPDISTELYLATNLQTDKSIINKVASSFKSIKDDGRFDKIMAKWNLPVQ